MQDTGVIRVRPSPPGTGILRILRAMSATGEAATRPRLAPGTRIEVRSAFDWAGGFAVEGDDGDRYVVRRRSDGEVLPVSFAPDDVRREKRQSMWWV